MTHYTSWDSADAFKSFQWSFLRGDGITWEVESGAQFLDNPPNRRGTIHVEANRARF